MISRKKNPPIAIPAMSPPVRWWWDVVPPVTPPAVPFEEPDVEVDVPKDEVVELAFAVGEEKSVSVVKAVVAVVPALVIVFEVALARNRQTGPHGMRKGGYTYSRYHRMW